MSETELETEGTEAPAEETIMVEPDEEEQDAADEEETTPEPEPEPEAQGLTPEEIAKRDKAITQSFSTYQRNAERHFGDDLTDMALCPLCSVTWHPGYVYTPDFGRYPEDVTRLTLTILGRAPAVEYEDDPEHRTCSRCKGLGKLRSGSKVPNWETLTCSACAGTGMLPPPGETAAGAVPAFVSTPADNGSQVQPQFADADEWGERPLLPDGRDNPNFGRMPHRKVMVEPWGVTAGLSAQDAQVSQRATAKLYPITRVDYNRDLRADVRSVIGYSFECSCGQKGAIQPTWQAARAAFENHRVECASRKAIA